MTRASHVARAGALATAIFSSERFDPKMNNPERQFEIRVASVPTQAKCTGCRDGQASEIDFDYAFQPIVDVVGKRLYACEALVRGPVGESAWSVLSQVTPGNRYAFDQACRTTAIARAAQLGLDAYLSINFLPSAVYRPEACIRSTLAAAQEHRFPLDRLIFETVESESVDKHSHLVDIFKAYREYGFQTAIDDFGAGHSGLTLLADFQPDLVKLDIALVRNVDTDRVRQRICIGVVTICRELGVRVLAEGIETPGERDFFLAHGVTLMQGYLFAKPGFRTIPSVPVSTYG
jgi:EAL domain-containing protein (putative c-di-GMP-specific phosphodiesterase class I)